MKRKPTRSASRRDPRKSSRRARPVPLRRASWARRVEAATLSRRPGDADAALALFGALPLPDQIALAREIADTRAAELTRAYADVVAVAYGFRRRRGRTGVPSIERIPCLKILVKRKREKREVDPRRLVPEHLFAYATLDGRRRLCAVPTDVEDARVHARGRPHASLKVLASPPHVTGVLTCAIERSGERGVPYVLSCRHVLGSAAGTHAAVTFADAGGPSIATAVDVAGILDDVAQASLDCQIARVEDPVQARVALGHGVDLGMGDPDDAFLVQHVYIMTPGRSIRAKVNAIRRDGEHPIPYGPALGMQICHEALLELDTELPTRSGDSGSAVLTEPEGGLLVGMLIAGPPDSTPDAPGSFSYAIPAAHMLDAARYLGAGTRADETWRLVGL